MWLEAGSGPDPGHSHMGDAQMGGEPTSAPVGAAVRRRLAGGVQDAGLQAVGLGPGLTAPVSAIEAFQAGFQEALLPALDEVLAAIQALSDGGVGKTISQKQDELGTENVVRPQVAGASPRLEFTTLSGIEHQRGRSEHDSF